MKCFEHLPYAPAKSFQWIADEREYVQMCGFLTIARLLMKKGDMNGNETAMIFRPGGLHFYFRFLPRAQCSYGGHSPLHAA